MLGYATPDATAFAGKTGLNSSTHRIAHWSEMIFDLVRSEVDHLITADWVVVVAKQLRLESTVKSHGRPKRKGKDPFNLPHLV
jgi:hypothetical protein